MKYGAPIKSSLQGELDRLNRAIDDAIEERTRWLDAHMAEAAPWPIGTQLFELESGKPIGTVSSYYRVHGDNPEYDRYLDVECQVLMPSPFSTNRCYTNTSSTRGKLLWGDKAEYRARLESELIRVRGVQP